MTVLQDKKLFRHIYELNIYWYVNIVFIMIIFIIECWFVKIQKNWYSSYGVFFVVQSTRIFRAFIFRK